MLTVTAGESWYRWDDLPERRRSLRDRRLLDISESGHMVHQDQPERLAEAVTSFLAGQEPEGSQLPAEGES